MKTIFLCTTILFLLGSCNKGIVEAKSAVTDADILFDRVKSDSVFLAFYGTVQQLTNIAISNAKNFPRDLNTRKEDSLFMRNSNISLKEKFEKMGYKGQEEVQSLTLKSIEYQSDLANRFPIWLKLNDVERKKFFSICAKYFSKNKK